MAREVSKQQEEIVAEQPDPTDARQCRREFYIMSASFSLNHATVTTPIIYASSVLTNSAGQGSDATLYGATLLSSLFISNLLFSKLGAKKGLSLSMLLFSIYVLLFAYASSLCVEQNSKGACIRGDSLQLPLAILGSIIGGLGAGGLWTCQGAFYSVVCECIAQSEGKELEAVTAYMSGTFALVFLGAECGIRALATLLHSYAGMSYPAMFYLYTGLAFLATVAFQILATDLPRMASAAPRKGGACQKVLATVSLWNDPKIWLLQATNITFSFAAAWIAGYVGRQIFSKALNNGFLGFAGALLSFIAAIMSKVFAPLSVKVGKGPVLALGSVAFLCLGVFSKWVGDPSEWGWGVLIFYVFMGVGRAVYESTNKAIFADFFPGEKSAAAFANAFVFGTAAGTLAYILGALNDDAAEFYLLLVFAVLTMPGFVIASALKKREMLATDLKKCESGNTETSTNSESDQARVGA